MSWRLECRATFLTSLHVDLCHLLSHAQSTAAAAMDLCQMPTKAEKIQLNRHRHGYSARQ